MNYPVGGSAASFKMVPDPIIQGVQSFYFEREDAGVESYFDRSINPYSKHYQDALAAANLEEGLVGYMRAAFMLGYIKRAERDDG